MKARPHGEVTPLASRARLTPERSPRDLLGFYGLPTDLDGHRQCIGVIAPGGGYRAADLDIYFRRLGLSTPEIATVSIHGATNDPLRSPYKSAVEVTLNLEVAGAVAHGARFVVYFTLNTDRGWTDAVWAALSEPARRPSVLLITWGCAEPLWAPETVNALEDAFAEAAALGVTVCCATGNNGSSGGLDDGVAHVEFPGSSPSVLACGGTSVHAGVGGVAREVVWNDGPDGGCTGGGVSDLFGLPSWQEGCGVPPSANPGRRVGRGVPDVAAAATGYQLRVFDQDISMTGTSAAASFWAGLIALHKDDAERAQRSGFLNPLLYSLATTSRAFRDVTTGNNGAYIAGPGWNPCTGWGSPRGAALPQLLRVGHQSRVKQGVQ